MPSISSCPECHRDLTLPDLADGKQALRCPLCDAQFLAEQVMADSVGFPPAAIVVPTSDTSQPALDDRSERERWSTATSSPTTTDDDSAPSMEPDSRESDSDESYENELDGETAEQGDSSSEHPAAAASEDPSDYASFGQQAASMRTAPRTRQQASPLGILGQLLGIVIGGAMGLAIGYWVLLWIAGPQVDFLHLRGKLPRWMVPARRQNEARKNLPVAGERGTRSGQAGRSLGDVLRDEPEEKDRDAPGGETAPSAVEPAPDDTPSPDEPPAASDARLMSPAGAPVEGLPLRTPGFPDGYLGPLAFKSRTVSELTASLEKAEHALRCPHCQTPSAVKLAAFTADDTQPVGEDLLNSSSRRCEYCRGKPPTNLTVAAFGRVCDLAEVVTFVRLEHDDPQRDECRQAVEAIALAIGSQRDRVETAGRLAGKRLDESQRQSNGILLAGTVQRAEREGDLFAVQLMLSGCGKQVTVISRQAPEPPVARRDRLIVLGSIVDSPRDNLAGYAGTLPQVVWGGLPLKLASPAR